MLGIAKVQHALLTHCTSIGFARKMCWEWAGRRKMQWSQTWGGELQLLSAPLHPAPRKQDVHTKGKRPHCLCCFLSAESGGQMAGWDGMARSSPGPCCSPEW